MTTPMPTPLLCLLSLWLAVAPGAWAEECAASPAPTSYNYAGVFSDAKSQGIKFSDLPGFTRSIYRRDHALITPESRVWASFPGWSKSVTAHLVSPASGAHFSMYLADVSPGGQPALPWPDVERFVLVLKGKLEVTPLGDEGGDTLVLGTNAFAFFPPGWEGQLESSEGAGLLVYERVHSAEGTPEFRHGLVDEQPALPTAGEVFVLRKLLPPTSEHDFNIHVMDFRPGEYLNVKEVHYNQHGLLLLQGQGIYRLADQWYPVQAGDAIWMAPYVPQWYAALGSENTRYIIYKDTTVDPLQT